MSDLIIFDVGGILIKMDFKTMFAELAKHSELSPANIQDRFAETAIDKFVQLGHDEKNYYNKIRTILENHTVSDKELSRILELSIPEPINEMVLLKQRLHDAGYEIGILSTMSRWGHEYIDHYWPQLLECWDGPRVFSYEARLIKPDPAIYRLFAKKNRTFYIEDKSAYLKYPVENLHWIGIHITAYQDLDEPIRRMGDGHQNVAHINGDWCEAATPADVEKILQDKGLKF